MPYALFSQEAKISRSYPTEAEVWKHAAQNGLVVDVASDADDHTPRRVLDNDYEIRPCESDTPDTHDPRATDIELSDIAMT